MAKKNFSKLLSGRVLLFFIKIEEGYALMDNFRDVLRVQGINSMDFGNISKLVMKDRFLTVESKAFIQFLQYAGARDTHFPQ
jgi:hypothetical protein